jgi:hypothetical protein
MLRVFGWALLMLFTGLATAWLRGVVDPLLPADDWHGMHCFVRHLRTPCDPESLLSDI